MTKTFGTHKLTNPKHILRRVLSKTSTSSKTSTEEGQNVKGRKERLMDGPKETCPANQSLNVEAELEVLKEQIGSLQLAVNSMQNETDKKEMTIANLAKEKELLAADLKKQQRTNTTLKQQLDEEREFYYKEKEIYCQEMNDCKKLKKTLKVGDYKAQIDHYKREIGKLKETLTQTLEANYNLSVKFLRMKNTKYCIKNRLKKLESVHEHTTSALMVQIEQLKAELVNVVDEQLLIPIPPSNKKYLQIVKQNSTLAHENLCLRLELDKLNLQLEKHRMLDIQIDTNSKLQYINHKTRSEPQFQSAVKSSPGHDRKESKSDYAMRPKDAVECRGDSFELYSMEHDEKHSKRKAKRERDRDETQITTISEEPIERNEINGERDFDMLRLNLTGKPSETFTLSSEYTRDTYDAVRAQSAPEIVQSSLFFNDK